MTKHTPKRNFTHSVEIRNEGEKVRSFLTENADTNHRVKLFLYDLLVRDWKMKKISLHEKSLIKEKKNKEKVLERENQKLMVKLMKEEARAKIKEEKEIERAKAEPAIQDPLIREADTLEAILKALNVLTENAKKKTA